MPKIRILPDRVANQIAAGEVIERPAAVIKELVENALDAGATRIEVEFSHGGRSLLRVEDNGCGMSRDDALISLERHATSKIVEADDLNRLASFGFRGEALPSIASISRFTLQTREQGSDLGTEVFVNGGKLIHVRECGRPVGTRIEVAQLFHPVPARRKFLKSDQTEAAHIIQCVRLYALASARVSFTLIEDGKVIFSSPQCSSLSDRVGEIFGRQLAADLVPLESKDEGLELSGLIGKPGQGRATRHEMVTFVNGRPVDSRTINYALVESYHESLPKGRYPMVFLFLEIDPAAVDVNVHPAKREVRFRSEPQVRGFVIRSVLRRLRELGLEMQAHQVPPVAAPAPAAPVWKPVQQAPVAAPAAFRTPSSVPSPLAPRPASAPAAHAAVPVTAPVPPVPAFRPAAPARPQALGWRFLGVAHGSYALFETQAGLVLLDRRASLERVWFERLKRQYAGEGVSVQRLLLPVPVELDAVSSALLLDQSDYLEAHGLEVAQFGRNFFRIEAIPDWMEMSESESLLRDLLGALREGRIGNAAGAAADEEFARLAASKAVRLSSVVSESEIQSLVTDLFATSMPLTSPSGRPTLIEWGLGELQRRFSGR